MGGQGSNPNGKDRQSNKKNQSATEAMDREIEEWMEQYNLILNYDEPINFQEMLAECGTRTTPRDGNADTKMLQKNSELNTAHSRKNDADNGNNLIITLDDDSDDDDVVVDSICQSNKRKLPDDSSDRTLRGEASRAREVSEEDINSENSQTNFFGLEQQDVQVHNGARNGTEVNVGTVTQLHPNPMGQGWVPQRSILSGTDGSSSVIHSPVSLRNQPTQPTEYNSNTHVPILPRMPVPPPMQPSEMTASFRPVYYNPAAPYAYQPLIWSNNFDSVHPPGLQMGDTPNRSTNMNYQMSPGTADSSSTSPTSSQSPRPRGPSQVANNQVESSGPVRTASVSMPNEVSSGASNANQRPDLTMDSLREAGVPRDEALNLVTASERARLINEVLNEIRNALRLMRENPAVGRVEDLPIFERSIARVSAGLADDLIETFLKNQKYRAAAFGDPSENSPCCICLEEYVEGDDTAKMRCGHYFHLNCIKKWLKEKDTCPICKQPAISVENV